jgi:hypothetical protein
VTERELATPLIIDGDKATRLERVPLGESLKPESWLQELLFSHPGLLPAGQIDHAFEDLLPVTRELRTPSGPVDLLYVNAKGYLCLVETKLWRNPEARRSVVGQVIDYAQQVARWSYDDLVQAVRRSSGAQGTTLHPDPLIAALHVAGQQVDEKVFIDSVSRTLRRGSFLLLIVGDGIQEGIEHMVEFLQRSPQLLFTLGLVEMAIFRFTDGGRQRLLVLPRTLARTREVTRAVVEVRGVDPQQVTVTLPEQHAAVARGRDQDRPPGTRMTMEEDAYYDHLLAAAGPEVVDFVRSVVTEAPARGLEVIWGDAGPMLKYVDERDGSDFTFGSMTKDGQLGRTMYLSRRCQELGLPANTWQGYLDALASLVPGVARKPTKRPEWEFAAYQGRAEIPLNLLVPHKDAWLAAIDQAVDGIRRALEGRAT